MPEKCNQVKHLRIEKSLDKLSGANWFSMIESASGYNQVPITQKHGPKTTFSTTFVLFQFNRVQFGLCNARGKFQTLIEAVFRAQHCQSLMLYLDDNIVFSSSVDEYLSHVVLSCQQQEGPNVK